MDQTQGHPNMELLGTAISVAKTLNSELTEALSILSRFSVFCYAESEMEDLQRTVEFLTAVLQDADTAQQLSQQQRVYIMQIKDVVFDADDQVDELLTLAQQKRILDRLDADGNLSLREKVSLFFSKSNPIRIFYCNWIKDLKKKLDAIAYNNQFNWKTSNPTEPIKTRSLETCSFVQKAEIIGREDDLEYIVGNMLDPDDQTSDVSFLSIVGMGGLGKTALAQLVYNDPRVTEAFPLKMWTCVSDEDQKVLNVNNILVKILGGNQRDLALQQVQSKLRATLAGKKYLLVLDDVWTENPHEWCELVKYLKGNKRGSWILITTRSQNTAEIINGQIHQLPGLSKENSWRLFVRTAFPPNQPNHPHYDDELVDIGEKIVDGCAQVPLAIRVAGTLLRGQDKNKWLYIQKIGLANIRNANNGIVPILELSFHHLELPLKNCFHYCAVFPKDYEINKEVLIRLWMTQGYVVPLDVGQSIDDAAEEYFSILLKRCFFQDIKINEDGEIVSCKIHDLMHDLAKKMSENEIYALNTISGRVGKNIRHLSIFDTRQFEKYCSLASNHIRSLLSFDRENQCQLSVHALVEGFQRLRMLDLSAKNIEHLPDSIGELLHLRYLDLSRNNEMEVVPNSITNLCNLQTLILHDCKSLKELPKDLSRLVKLLVFDIEGCIGLRWMPRSMGKMTCLHTLKGAYIVGGDVKRRSWKQWLDGLEDLKLLVKLKGQLQLRIKWPEKNAKHDVNEDSLRERSYLKSLEHVNNLKLEFEGEDDSGRTDEGIKMRVMEALYPNSNLKRLVVCGYGGTEMPGWLADLPNLVKLRFENCKELKFLPAWETCDILIPESLGIAEVGVQNNRRLPTAGADSSSSDSYYSACSGPSNPNDNETSDDGCSKRKGKRQVSFEPNFAAPKKYKHCSAPSSALSVMDLDRAVGAASVEENGAGTSRCGGTRDELKIREGCRKG